MFSTIRSQLLALAVLALFALFFVAGVSFYAQKQLTLVLADAEGLGVAMRNHMQSDMSHDNLRGLVEQHTGAVRDNDAARIQKAAEDLTANAKNIQEEFAKNKTVDALPAPVLAEIVRVEPIVKKYVQAALAVSVSPIADTVALEKTRSDFSEQFKVLKKELSDIREKIETAVKDAKIRGANTAATAALLIVAALVFASILVGAFSFVIYRNVTSGLTTISQTIVDVNAGDVAARTGLTVSNELGDVGRSFDKFLDDRIAALERVNKKNETLNNSVVSLLQTVFQLGNRDLTVRATVTEDVIGTVSSSINQLSIETGRTLSDIKKISQQVLHASESVSTQAHMMDGIANNAEKSLQSMASSLTTAVEQLVQVAELSNQSNLLAGKATTATKSALATVDSTVSGMSALGARMTGMESRFKQLVERTKDISNAVGLVNALTERTNLLALSASTQAAAAGEAGRGFMVVAQEVRRLSDSSQQATAEITKIVSSIQSETNETLYTMSQVMQNVAAQTGTAKKAGADMAQTQATTADLVNLVRRIAGFAEQQTTIASQLESDLATMRKGTTQTLEASAAQAASAKTLVEYSKRMTQSIGQFKL